MNVDANCSLVPQEDFVTFNNNCTVHILKMCNGLMHCDDCADEDFDDCMAQQCSECKNSCFYSNKCLINTCSRRARVFVMYSVLEVYLSYSLH